MVESLVRETRAFFSGQSRVVPVGRGSGVVCETEGEKTLYSIVSVACVRGAQRMLVRTISEDVSGKVSIAFVHVESHELRCAP